MKINPHVLKWSTSLSIVAAMSIISMVLAQNATHPSEDYPGKGGASDTTNAASGTPQQVNPSTGGQNMPSTTPPKSSQ